jgi:hypothetical protein
MLGIRHSERLEKLAELIEQERLAILAQPKDDKYSLIDQVLNEAINKSGLEGRADKIRDKLTPALDKLGLTALGDPQYRDSLIITLVDDLNKSKHTNLRFQKTIRSIKLSEIVDKIEKKVRQDNLIYKNKNKAIVDQKVKEVNLDGILSNSGKELEFQKKHAPVMVELKAAIERRQNTPTVVSKKNLEVGRNQISTSSAENEKTKVENLSNTLFSQRNVSNNKPLITEAIIAAQKLKIEAKKVEDKQKENVSEIIKEMYKNAGLKEENNPDIAEILTEDLLKLDPKIIKDKAFKDKFILALKESVETNESILDEKKIILNALNKITSEIKDRWHKDKSTESLTIDKIKKNLMRGEELVKDEYSLKTPDATPYLVTNKSIKGM